MADPIPPIQIFLSYAPEDREMVEDLYQKLLAAGFKPWMDEMDILPGEVRREKIRSVIERSDFFLACLSPNSIDKRGDFQRELRFALDIWQEMPENNIYLIPVKLDECEVPKVMKGVHPVALYKPDGFSRLEKAIRKEIIDPINKGQVKGVEIDQKYKRPVSLKPNMKTALLLTILPGLLLAMAFFPRMYNNYYFHVDPVILPAVCQPSPEPLRVGITEITDCSGKFQEDLERSWSGDIAEIVKLPKVITTSEEARKLVDYDLVVWGSCIPSMDGETAHLNFELITSRKPYEVFEASTLKMTGEQSDLTTIGKALIRYQHGDYREAIATFQPLSISLENTDLDFFKANSQLFAEKYDEAIDTYKEIIRSLDPNAAAAYNNLGVALLNTERPSPEKPYSYQGLDEFSQAIKLAHDTGQSDIELLAYINRSYLYRLGNGWVDALADCNAAMAIDSKSALPNICMASYYFSNYSKPQKFGMFPLLEINQYLSEAEAAPDAPALVHLLRANWNLAHSWKQKQAAMEAYKLFFASMENRACLRRDKDRVDEARRIIQKYLVGQ